MQWNVRTKRQNYRGRHGQSRVENELNRSPREGANSTSTGTGPQWPASGGGGFEKEKEAVSRSLVWESPLRRRGERGNLGKYKEILAARTKVAKQIKQLYTQSAAKFPQKKVAKDGGWEFRDKGEKKGQSLSAYETIRSCENHRAGRG